MNTYTKQSLLTASVGGVMSLMLGGLPAQAASFSGVYTFGDSLSDPGNLFIETGGFYPPSPKYVNGRFSNGPVWVEYLTEELGLNPTPVAVNPIPSGDGVNYAFGGARTDDTNNIPSFPGLEQQLEFFRAPLLATSQKADSDALYILWAGGNDYTSGGVQNPFEPVSNLSNAVKALFNLGARNFLVANLPDLSQTPLIKSFNNPVLANQLQSLVNGHNVLLQNSIQELNQSLTGAKVSLFDTYSLVNNVITNPQQFGFTNVTNSCVSLVLTPCSNPDEYLFWDDFHPTTKGHQVLANTAYSQIQEDFKPVPEPGTVFALSGLGLGLLIQKRMKKAS